MKNNRLENAYPSTTRRDFIRQTSMAGAAALIAPSLFASGAKKSYKMGLQLFTMRADMRKDAVGSLKRIAAIGYQDLETYGYDPETNKYYGLPASEFKQVLADNNLTTSSGHYDLFKFLNGPDADLKKYVDQCIVGAHAIGQQYITWPWLDEQSRSLDSLQPGRFVMWHIKDMSKEKRYTELGNGTIDFTKIMPDIDLAGMQYYFVEQGDYFTVNPFQSITDSAAYVRKNLSKWV
jgi:sugar phosphate isomerase/epimerase